MGDMGTFRGSNGGPGPGGLLTDDGSTLQATGPGK